MDVEKYREAVTIYEISEFVRTAFVKAMTPVNIINAFKKTGIFPFDRNLFTDDDFLPSSVTDRLCPDCEIRIDAENNLSDTQQAGPSNLSQTTNYGQNYSANVIQSCKSLNIFSTNHTIHQEASQLVETKPEVFVSPFQFRDSIKAGPRKTNRQPRKLGRSIIVTDTPEKKK